ncbi:uncharacterized protein CXorf65 homolog [Pyxicephalus adspersus]|uniref:Uncharacterized protein n=1 Tax=Pyxicephalus adspersus TaxID=30357 RepID=A0AAV3A5L8_PYXAD|nr:TPA: hypothetical protein GDO54_018348 [Pyxicephalus adspersus]
MFICIIHGDNQQFVVNVQCRVIPLLHHIRKMLHLPDTATIDLCDRNGNLKLMFLVRNYDESAEKFVTPREAYYVCKVDKQEPGSKSENVYRQITILLSSPTPEITDVLKAQRKLIEKRHHKLLRAHKAKLSAARD